MASRPDEREYPYAAQRPAAIYSSPPSPLAAAWLRIWRWLKTAAIVVAALLAITLIAAGIFAYRVTTRAWTIADLEQRGCTIQYWHQNPYNQDLLPPWLRERVGDYCLSEVRDVSIGPRTGWGGWPSSDVDDEKAALAACSSFRKLKCFQIESNRFSCDQIADWPHLDQIEQLHVTSTKLSDADLAVIGRMKSLKYLWLGSAHVTSQGLEQLAKLPALESLTLHEVEFRGSPASSKPRGMQALVRLTISESPHFGDDGIASLGLLPNLEELSVYRTPVGDTGIAELLRGGKIHDLAVEESQITNAIFALLGDFEDGGSVRLSGKSLTDEGLKSLAGKRIPELFLGGSAITDGAFRTLAQVKDLDSLSLADTAITGTGAGDWDRSRLLERLDLHGASLTPAGVAAVAQMNCKQLSLAQTFVGDNELMLFVNSDSLTQLDVTQTSVTEAGVKAFLKARRQRAAKTRRMEMPEIISDYSEGFDPITGNPY